MIELAIPTSPIFEPGGGEAAPNPLWARVDGLVDRAPALEDLYAHRLQLQAADRWRRLGRHVPELLAAEARANMLISLTARPLLERVRASCDGPLVLMKGPEVAALYPDPAQRSLRDLDLLVPDAAAVQRALLESGFVLTGDPSHYIGIHHLRPLQWQSLVLIVEIHERPKWVPWASPPPTEELVSAAVPSATGVDGILALPPEYHTLVLAAHSWAHEPLRRLRDFVDIAAVLEQADRRALSSLARRLGLERLWRTTEAAVDAALYGAATPLPLRIWARNLARVRERTVLESHLERWLAAYSVRPPLTALRQMAGAIATDLRPEEGEGWAAKLRRSGQALSRPRTPRSEHERRLGR